MSETTVVLFANEAFYAAFAARDLAAMDALWARRAAVSCIHPGWNAVHGREPVMQSWQAILTSPQAPAISCHGAEARITGSTALVVCYESLDSGVLVATNVFVREDGAWKMIHHQAGPAALAPPDPGITGPRPVFTS